MKIKLSSVFVDNQAKALKFYTEILGFAKKADEPVGAHRWLTVVSPDGPDDLELLLEPNAHPAARAFQEAIFADKIPATSFFVDDIHRVCEELKARGVVSTMDPTPAGSVIVAVFEDTCGNHLQLCQV